jgi:hypothetical protein
MNGMAFLFTEMANRGIRVFVEPFEEEGRKGVKWRLQGQHGEEWTDEWAELAGTLVEAITESRLLFSWGSLGKLTGHDWLVCKSCGCTQLCAKKDGAPSAGRRCVMTIGCKGKLRRFETDIFVYSKPGRRSTTSGVPRRTGMGTSKKGTPLNIRLEALEVADRTNMSEAARQMRAKYPQYKFSPSGITYWRKQREDNPEMFSPPAT